MRLKTRFRMVWVACGSRSRPLVLDYEPNPRSSKSQVYWTMNGIMLRRLTGASPITTYRIGTDDRITAAP